MVETKVDGTKIINTLYNPRYNKFILIYCNIAMVLKVITVWLNKISCVFLYDICTSLWYIINKFTKHNKINIIILCITLNNTILFVYFCNVYDSYKLMEKNVIKNTIVIFKY